MYVYQVYIIENSKRTFIGESVNIDELFKKVKLVPKYLFDETIEDDSDVIAYDDGNKQIIFRRWTYT